VSDTVPVLDYALLYSGLSDDRAVFAKALRHACTNVGFFYLRNHGIPDATIAQAYDSMRRFFALPLAQKMKIHYLNSRNHRGFVARGDSRSDRKRNSPDMHEAIELAQDLPESDPDFLNGNPFFGPNVWPGEPAAFQPAFKAYFDGQLQFGVRMLRGFALALDLPEEYFGPLFTKPMSRVRACYYPPQHPDWQADAMGIGAHYDFEIFTTVWSDQPGLQVLGTRGEWIDVPPLAGALVINIGDLMQRWSNDEFLSRPHRVVNLRPVERYSIVQFFGVDYDVVLDVFPSILERGQQPKYAPISCGAHVSERVAKVYYGA
jgi:isopenicillin N synthase-like dioxygenase